MKTPRHVCSSQEAVLSLESPTFDRREFLWRFGGGLGGIAMAHLLGANQLLADTFQPKPEFNGGLHHRAKAKRVVQLFMSGAASQCDTFDYKPQLLARHGQKFDPARWNCSRAIPARSCAARGTGSSAASAANG
jgi:Protein of unknown function (DUF1501)